MIRIENCSSLAVKDGLLYARGSTLFQGKVADVFMAKYTDEIKCLQLFYPNLEVSIIVPSANTPEHIANIFPQFFYRLHTQTMLQFFNFKLLSFLQMTRNAMVLHFSNGIPITVTIDEQNIIGIFSQCCSLQELLN